MNAEAESRFMDYEAEILKLMDSTAKRLGMLTGKPEARIKAAKRILSEYTDAVKKLVREKTLDFYEKEKKPPPPLFTEAVSKPAPEPYVPQAPPDARPPVTSENAESRSYLESHP